MPASDPPPNDSQLNEQPHVQATRPVGVDAHALDAASTWIARLRAPDVSHGDRLRFQRWLDLDPSHPLAFDAMLGMWDRLGVLEQIPVHVPRRAGVRTGFGRAIWPLAAAAVLLLSFVTFYRGSQPISAQTRVGEQRMLTLVDGSRLWLNTATSVRYEIGNSERAVELAAGELFVEVAPDAHRPFVIRTAHGTVTAVGTAFGVNSRPEGQRLAVTEGVVRVQLAGASASAAVDIEAGQVIDFDSSSTRSVSRRPRDALAWRSGELVYAELPLAEVIRDLNRYLPTPMTITDPKLGDRPVSAVLRIEDQAAMLDALAAILGLEWARSADDQILIRARS